MTRRGVLGLAALLLGVLGGAMVFVSCAHRLPDDDAAATAEVASWIPAGTTAAEAGRILESRGFRNVTLLRAGAPGNPARDDVVWADLARSDGLLAERRWQAILVLGDGKVAEVRVVSHVTGP